VEQPVFALNPHKGQLPLRAIRSAIPNPLPSPLGEQSCTSGTYVFVRLREASRMVSYGPCRLPPSIAQLKARITDYLATHT
jgi:hypothetical protein